MHIGEISVRSVIKPVKSRKQYMLKESMNMNVLSVIIKLDIGATSQFFLHHPLNCVQCSGWCWVGVETI